MQIYLFKKKSLGYGGGGTWRFSVQNRPLGPFAILSSLDIFISNFRFVLISVLK